MRHRKPQLTVAQKATRIGLLATVGLAAAATAVPANAAPLHSGPARDVGIAVDDVHAHADRLHPTRFADSFTVHQFGPLIAASVHNEADASSVACSPNAPCRSVALAFQIDTMAGTHLKLDASNDSRAVNDHCPGCQTFAGAWQFVVSTPEPFTLSTADQRQLASIHRQLDALRQSSLSIADVRSRAEGLAAQVAALLKAAAARAPKGPGANPLESFQPTVAMYRHLSG